MPTPHSPTTPSLRGLSTGALAATVAALAGNLAVFAVGSSGTPIRVVTGYSPDGADLTIPEIVATTVIAIAAGAALRWALTRTRFDGFRIWAGVAAAVAVISAVPLWRLDIDSASKVSLTVMHLWTGAACVAALRVWADGARSSGRRRPAPAERRSPGQLASSEV